MPYETIDNNGKAIFIIGMSTSSMNKRMDTYHTYFPEGVWYDAFLIDPPVRGQQTRTMSKLKKKREHYLEIEKFIIDHILRQAGTKRVHSTTRIRNVNENWEGETEWIYCKEENIHKAFIAAQKKYSGKMHLFHLDELNEKAREKENANPIYTGKVIFKA